MAASGEGFTLVTGKKGRGKAAFAVPKADLLDSLDTSCTLPDSKKHHPGLTFGNGGDAATNAAASKRAKNRRGERLDSVSPADKTMKRLDSICESMQGSGVAHSIEAGILQFIESQSHQLSGQDTKQSPNELSCVDIVCYGLGSLRYGSNPLQQLAALEVIRRVTVKAVEAQAARTRDAEMTANSAPLLPSVVSVSLYDPLFDETDVAVFQRLGYFVIHENESGFRKLRSMDATLKDPPPIAGDSVTAGIAQQRKYISTIFFLPHCGADLNGAVLAANWGPRLRSMCFIGNSLSWYRKCQEERIGAKSASGSSPQASDSSVLATASADSVLCCLNEAAAAVCVLSKAGNSVPATATAASGKHAPTGLRRVVERPITVPSGDQWEESYRALDATSLHTFEWVD